MKSILSELSPKAAQDASVYSVLPALTTQSNDLSLYGLANAVARHSQDVESYDRATDLEGIGFNILSMPPRQWTRINQTAA